MFTPDYPSASKLRQIQTICDKQNAAKHQCFETTCILPLIVLRQRVYYLSFSWRNVSVGYWTWTCVQWTKACRSN